MEIIGLEPTTPHEREEASTPRESTEKTQERVERTGEAVKNTLNHPIHDTPSTKHAIDVSPSMDKQSTSTRSKVAAAVLSKIIRVAPRSSQPDAQTMRIIRTLKKNIPDFLQRSSPEALLSVKSFELLAYLVTNPDHLVDAKCRTKTIENEEVIEIDFRGGKYYVYRKVDASDKDAMEYRSWDKFPTYEYKDDSEMSPEATSHFLRDVIQPDIIRNRIDEDFKKDLHRTYYVCIDGNTVQYKAHVDENAKPNPEEVEKKKKTIAEEIDKMIPETASAAVVYLVRQILTQASVGELAVQLSFNTPKLISSSEKKQTDASLWSLDFNPEVDDTPKQILLRKKGRDEIEIVRLFNVSLLNHTNHEKNPVGIIEAKFVIHMKDPNNPTITATTKLLTKRPSLSDLFPKEKFSGKGVTADIIGRAIYGQLPRKTVDIKEESASSDGDTTTRYST